MKKLFKMKLALCFMLMLLVPAISVNSRGPVMTNDLVISAANPLAYSYFCGRIGGDNNAWLQFDNNINGSYGFLNYTRILKFTSYNNRNGSLVLTAYERGTRKYIGKFVGKYSSYNSRYTGTFTNYKGGKVTFDLSICGAAD